MTRTRTDFSSRATAIHPLDVVERMANKNDWMFERRNDQEMAVQVPGRWCDYNLYFGWQDAVNAVLFTCAFDLRVPDHRLAPVYHLLALINEKIWLGHFTVWGGEGQPMFRHALPLRGVRQPSLEQIEDLVDAAVVECERFYPAFQYVVWAGKPAPEAIEAAMIETVGEA